MDAAALARLHGRCFTLPPPWSESAFAGLLAQPGVFLLTAPAGFLLGRVTLDEAELLTLAVDPDARRQGTGRRLVRTFETEARARGATRAFLEVAAGNAAARALYAAAGWQETGRRRGYFRAAAGDRDDALVLARNLP